MISGIEKKRRDTGCIMHADTYQSCFPLTRHDESMNETSLARDAPARGCCFKLECFKHPLHLFVRIYACDICPCVYDAGERKVLRCTPTRHSPPRVRGLVLHQAQ